MNDKLKRNIWGGGFKRNFKKKNPVLYTNHRPNYTITHR